MSLRLGDIAPDFTADTTEGRIAFHEWLGGGWGVLFSHPADFTPVCTTEFLAFARLQEDFRKVNCELVGLSVDSTYSHIAWLRTVKEKIEFKGQKNVDITFPVIADPERKVSQLYDMIHPNALENATVRSVFIVGPDKKVKLMLTYPASTGRNFDEILRVLDSLQLTAKHKVATPANWTQGQDCIIVPAVTSADAKDLFPKGFSEIKPYLRYTPQPTQTPVP